MSTATKLSRITIPDLCAHKGKEPIVSLTAYTAPMARMLDEHCDFLLVGDSMGMALYGMDSTLGVTLDMAINHGAAVVRGSKRACVIVDMPFGTYGESKEQAYRNAARVMAETGCSGIKIEGGVEMAETVKFLFERGIPVMGHVGLKPQSLHTAGGYRSQGRDIDAANKIMADSKAIADAGAFALVIEATVEALAREITEAIDIVTIGIGASSACDGQVLVAEDALGMFADFTPKFVRRYAEIGNAIEEAAASYAKDVKARTFPGPENCYGLKKK
ncbi:MAG: 3-methyl-2-oxobutanoate hydroxymethyltransferase [Proteobacteria bacterium]|nr:3-methyl-2-oxobutanoate hydroxymethyltransferase [Pseudomonadota bacterium]